MTEERAPGTADTMLDESDNLAARVRLLGLDKTEVALRAPRRRARFEASLGYDAAMKKRAGGTTHLSISLPTEEAKLLKRRAKRIYRGNVSRVVSDAIRYIAYEEGRDALIASFDGKGTPTEADTRQLDRDWGISAEKSA